ncbi:unnamed protein product [Gordionus sp. m RMFG-2023]
MKNSISIINRLTDREYRYDNHTFIKKEINYRIEKIQHYNLFQKCHKSCIYSMDINILNGNYLLSSSQDNIGIYYLHGVKGIRTVQWYPIDNGIFTTSGVQNKVEIWDTTRQKSVESYTFEYPINSHNISRISSNNPLIAVATNRICLIDMLSGSQLQTLIGGHKSEVKLIRWSNLYHYLIVSADDKKMILWDIRRGKRFLHSIDIRPYNHSKPWVQGLEFGKDCHKIGMLNSDGKLYTYDLLNINTESNAINFDNIIGKDQEKLLKRFIIADNSYIVPLKNKIIKYKVDNDAFKEFKNAHFGDITNCIAHPINDGIFYTSSLDASILEWSIQNIY